MYQQNKTFVAENRYIKAIIRLKLEKIKQLFLSPVNLIWRTIAKNAVKFYRKERKEKMNEIETIGIGFSRRITLKSQNSTVESSKNQRRNLRGLRKVIPQGFILFRKFKNYLQKSFIDWRLYTWSKVFKAEGVMFCHTRTW